MFQVMKIFSSHIQTCMFVNKKCTYKITNTSQRFINKTKDKDWVY